MATKKSAKKVTKSSAKSAKAPSVKVQAAAPVVTDTQAAPVSDANASAAVTKGTGVKIQPNRAEQNGVVRPSEGTLCARVWSALDTLRAEGKEITIEAIRELAGTDMADATIRTQRQRHRTFLGLPRNAKPSKSAATEAPNPG